MLPCLFRVLCRSVCDISICVLAPIALQVERVCTRCCPSPSACSSPSSPRATSRKLRKRRSTMPILSETPVVAAAAAARDDRSSVYMSANVYIMCESASPPNGCCVEPVSVCVYRLIFPCILNEDLKCISSDPPSSLTHTHIYIYILNRHFQCTTLLHMLQTYTPPSTISFYMLLVAGNLWSLCIFLLLLLLIHNHNWCRRSSIRSWSGSFRASSPLPTKAHSVEVPLRQQLFPRRSHEVQTERMFIQYSSRTRRACTSPTEQSYKRSSSKPTHRKLSSFSTAAARP